MCQGEVGSWWCCLCGRGLEGRYHVLCRRGIMYCAADVSCFVQMDCMHQGSRGSWAGRLALRLRPMQPMLRNRTLGHEERCASGPSLC